MKRFSTYLKPILPLAAALALPLTQGCSDDLFRNGEGDGNSERGVVVYVPKVQPGQQLGGSGRTRGALNDYKANEGDINTLHLFAYPAAGGAAQVFDLLGGDVKTSTSAPEDYQGYVLDLTPGDYRLYVVANVDFTDAASLTEKSLKDYEVKVPESAKEGLPMSCSNSGMTVSYNGAATYSTVGEQGVNVAGGATVKVKADLKFAVAKVRVTMLNDLRPDLELESASLGSMADISSLMTDGSVTATIGTADFMEASYYTLPEMQPDLLDVDVENMDIQAVRPDDGWAWQGTAYVAERLFDADEANPSTVNLTLSDGTEKVLTVGTKGEGLKRSYFYDYVGNSKGEFVVEVQPWDAITIAGALHGPYYLHVDETSLSIEAGQSTSIWYESNAPIECVSNTYTPAGGDPIDIYQFAITDNSISISVSPQIKAAELEKVKAETGWQSFVIKAGTIEKRIDVKELNLHEFLTVDVNSVTIDIREQVASGIYTGSFVIPVRTNLEQFTIDRVSWSGVTDEITLCNPDGEAITDFDIQPGESGVYNLQVRFTGLNDGLSFWQSSRQLQFTVSGTFADGTAVSETVNVNVLASNEDYIIHLHAPGWTSPHIYVYQSLKLPAGSAHPNAPVGDGTGNAALEYCFTGAAAFKGWNVTTDGVNYNNPNDQTTYDDANYFYTFSGGDSQGGWVIGKDNWTRHYYDMDFCESYRQTVSCSKCKDVNNARLWPGIQMESEGDGWWVFRLSGIATPGQALIMFTDAKDDHTANGSNRYPGSNEPGVPLFDYPTREGYFSVGEGTTYQFTSTKPDVGGAIDLGYKYRIYWPYSSNWTGLNIWRDGGSSWGNSAYDSSNFSNGVAQSGSNGGTYRKYDSSYAYIEFTATSQNSFLYQAYPSYGDKYTIPNLTDTDEDGYYCYTITAAGIGYSGKPKAVASTDVTIYYKGQSGSVPQGNTLYIDLDGTRTQMSKTTLAGNSDWWVVKVAVPENVSKMKFCSNSNNDSYVTSSYSTLLSDIATYGTTLYYEFQSDWKVMRVEAPSEGGGDDGDDDEYATYRIGWYKSYDNVTREYIYVWNFPSGALLADGSALSNQTTYRYDSTSSSDSNLVYFTFKVKKTEVNSASVSFLFKSQSGTSDWSGQIGQKDNLSLSSFTGTTPTYTVSSF
ncbi:MAG: hypothetical protein K2O78_07350 [Muribaculaceae bacterium]|nr:hypothetical protein [Muribaculaceae bacterium]